MPPKHILIVDDDPDNLLILGMKLKSKGYAVHTAPSASAALRSAALRKPDVIILDILMPGTNGTDLGEKFRQNKKFKNVPVLFVSSLQRKEDEVKPGLIGPSRIFSKPVDIERLDLKIKEVLAE